MIAALHHNEYQHSQAAAQAKAKPRRDDPRPALNAARGPAPLRARRSLFIRYDSRRCAWAPVVVKSDAVRFKGRAASLAVFGVCA